MVKRKDRVYALSYSSSNPLFFFFFFFISPATASMAGVWISDSNVALGLFGEKLLFR